MTDRTTKLLIVLLFMAALMTIFECFIVFSFLHQNLKNRSDINLDGQVNLKDFSIMLAHWTQ